MLLLAEPILHEVWPSLFDILHSLDWYNRFSCDWNQVVSEDHDQNCRETQLCILAVSLQIWLLQAKNLYVPQGMFFIEFSGLVNLNKSLLFPGTC